MPVDDTTLAVLSDIAIHLLLGLLTRELEIGSEEMLGINPSARYAVDSDIIQEQKIGSYDGPAFAILLLG